MGATLISIAYVSRARHIGEDDVSDILAQSRENNLRLGLTGALLHQPGKYIQILEGPEAEVRAVYRKISLDPRHRSIHLVSSEPIETRQFAEWSMGFRSLSSEAAKQLSGFGDFFARSSRSSGTNTDPSAQMFLDWLSEYWFTAA
jgi:hypothetical protein